jgi:hypothetical protein
MDPELMIRMLTIGLGLWCSIIVMPRPRVSEVG